MDRGVGEDESALLILVAVDVESGSVCDASALQGYEARQIRLREPRVVSHRLGYDKVILQPGAEHAVNAVAKALQQHLGSARV